MLHDLDGLLIIIHQKHAATKFKGSYPRGAAACKEIQHQVAWLGGSQDNAAQDTKRFLGGIARFLLAGGADDGVPPSISRQLAASGFFFANQAGSHIGNALYIVNVERVMLVILHVEQDIVVLCRPAVFGATTVVISPDDFVEEIVALEDLIQQDLAIMDFAVVHMKIEAAIDGQHAMGLP